jgi:hypothetical protein
MDIRAVRTITAVAGAALKFVDVLQMICARSAGVAHHHLTVLIAKADSRTRCLCASHVNKFDCRNGGGRGIRNAYPY